MPLHMAAAAPLQRVPDRRVATLLGLSTLPAHLWLHAGECGTSVATQWAIRAELRAKFAHKAWLDVFTKQDLLQGVQQSAAAAGCGGGSHIVTACSLPEGVHASMRSKGQEAIFARNGDASGSDTQQQQPTMTEREDGSMQQQASSNAASEHASSSSSRQEGVADGNGAASASGRSFSWSDRTDGGLQTALQVAHALPGAVWVSSVTDDGMADLKACVLQMLQRQASALPVD